MKRNQGIEILRILCIFFIFVSHFCYHGVRNIYKLNYIGSTINNLFLLGNMGVVIFMIISGYFYGKSFSWKKVLQLLIVTTFYSVTLYMITILFQKTNFSIKEFINALFPLFSNQYWFITTYIIIYIFKPFTKTLIDKQSMKNFKSMLLLFFILILVKFFLNFKYSDVLYINDLIELFFYYLLGAYLKKKNIHKIVIRKRYIFISILIMFISVIVLNYLKVNNSTILYQRNSITVIIVSIWLFKMFSNINISSKIVPVFSPCVLGVYLIHDNLYFRDILWNLVLNNHNIIVAITIMLFAFAGCFLIEKVRIIIFNHTIDKLL